MSVEKLVFYFWKETNYIALPPGKRSPSWRRERERNIWGIASSHRWHWWIISLSLLQHAAEQNRTEMAHSAHLSIPDSLGSNGRIGRRRGWEGQRENQWVRGEKKSCCKSRWLDNELNDYQSLAWKVAQKSQFISQPAPRPHQPIKSPAGRQRWDGGGGRRRGMSLRSSFSIFLSICFSHWYFSLWFSLAAHRCVCYCGPRLSLWETENSQGHNYRTELSISPSINPVGREGDEEEEGEQAEKGAKK